MSFRRAFAVALAVLLAVGGAVSAKAQALDGEREQLVAEAEQLSAELTSIQARGEVARLRIEEGEDEHEVQAAVLEMRPAFRTAIEALVVALDAADGRIDVDAHRAAAIAAQETVLAEREDPEAVANATATIEALTAKVDGEVADWQSRQPVAVPGVNGTSSGASGYAKVRQALDRVGGAGIGLYEAASCAGGSAAACANSNGYIKYRADIATWSDDRLNWAMAHELAHIYQFQVWGALTSAAAYQSMFGGDPEFLANCMAVVRGFPGSVGCSGDQQAWASGIWVGAVQ